MRGLYLSGALVLGRTTFTDNRNVRAFCVCVVSVRQWQTELTYCLTKIKYYEIETIIISVSNYYYFIVM